MFLTLRVGRRELDADGLGDGVGESVGLGVLDHDHAGPWFLGLHVHE